MNQKRLKLCQVQQVDEKAMIRNLRNRIPLASPVTIIKISNDYHRNIDVSLVFFFYPIQLGKISIDIP